MRSKDFFLLFKNVANLFLESKELFVLLISHGSFHGVEIISDFFLLFHFSLFLNFNFFVNGILFNWLIFLIVDAFLLFVQRRVAAVGWVLLVIARSYNWFFVWVWSVLLSWLLFLSTLLLINRRQRWFWLLSGFLWYLGRIIAAIGFWDVFWN